MKKDRLEFDKSFLKKVKEERKAKKEKGVADEEQQDLMGQVAEPKKEKKIKLPKVKKEKVPKEKKAKVPKEKKITLPKIKKEKEPKEIKPGSFSALQSMQMKVMVLVAVSVIVSVFALYTPVFWPGEFHGLYSPCDCKRVRYD